MIKDIQKTDLLNDNAIAELSSLAKELEDTFNTVQIHRTRTEMEVSVLNDLKFPTASSKYWQALREQNAMLQGITALSFDYREEVVNAKILLNDIKEETDGLKRELLQIKLERKEFLVKDMKRTAMARIREIKDWSEIKKRESETMSKEDLADPGNHQLISYTQRWINQTMEMGNNGSPSENQNLLGQLRSGINLCINKGIINKVLEVYNNDIKRQILLEYGVRD